MATESGNYNVVATDENGCEVEAVINNVIAGLTPALSKGEGFSIFPNPVNDKLEIRNITQEKEFSFTIYNKLGSAVPLETGKCKQGTYILDVSSLDAGMYCLKLTSGDGTFTTKFIKQ